MKIWGTKSMFLWQVVTGGFTVRLTSLWCCKWHNNLHCLSQMHKKTVKDCLCQRAKYPDLRVSQIAVFSLSAPLWSSAVGPWFPPLRSLLEAGGRSAAGRRDRSESGSPQDSHSAMCWTPYTPPWTQQMPINTVTLLSQYSHNRILFISVYSLMCSVVHTCWTFDECYFCSHQEDFPT